MRRMPVKMYPHQSVIRQEVLHHEDPYRHVLDVVFETAGSKYTIKMTTEIARRGGLVVLVGMSAESEVIFNVGCVMEKELVIKSLFRYVNMFPKSVATVASGLAPIGKVATNEYDLKDIQQAFMDSIHKKNEVVKAVIRMDD